MEESLRKLISRAHRENRLAAVLVDLQSTFLDDYTAAAFDGTRALASTMRQAGVPIIWVTYPFIHRTLKDQISTVWEYNAQKYGEGDVISGKVMAQPNETVIIKNQTNALDFQNTTALEIHLDTLGADTIIAGGVLAHGCLGATIKNGLLMDRYNFIAAADSIDIDSKANYKNFITNIFSSNVRNSKLELDLSIPARRFHVSDTPSIAQALPLPKRTREFA